MLEVADKQVDEFDEVELVGHNNTKMQLCTDNDEKPIDTKTTKDEKLDACPFIWIDCLSENYPSSHLRLHQVNYPYCICVGGSKDLTVLYMP